MGKGIVGCSMVIDHFGTNRPDSYEEAEREERARLPRWRGQEYTNRERWEIYRERMFNLGDNDILQMDERKPPKWFGPHVNIPQWDHFNYKPGHPKKVKAKATKPPRPRSRVSPAEVERQWKPSVIEGCFYSVETNGKGSTTYHLTDLRAK